MKKAMLIIILSAMLTACGTTENTTKEEPTAVTSTVSQTTTAAEKASKAVTSSETTTTTTVTTAKAKTTAKTTTTKAETTTSKLTTKKTVSETTTTRQSIQQTETYIVYYDESASETQQPEVKETETTTTTVQTTPPTATATSPPTTTTTAPPSGIEWSDSMKGWRKLCEGKKLTGGEQDIIRNEILDYAVSTFNGKKDIHVSFGIDSYDISYEKPLNLTVNRGMTSMANAHMDAYADPNSKWLIDYASGEDEIYAIVSDTRESCLHVIDHGLFNRWEIFTINNSMKYASDIKFNVGFDEDMTIWFLTQD